MALVAFYVINKNMDSYSPFKNIVNDHSDIISNNFVVFPLLLFFTAFYDAINEAVAHSRKKSNRSSDINKIHSHRTCLCTKTCMHVPLFGDHYVAWMPVQTLNYPLAIDEHMQQTCQLFYNYRVLLLVFFIIFVYFFSSLRCSRALPLLLSVSKFL